jgi:excisionase family DNA binding protein
MYNGYQRIILSAGANFDKQRPFSPKAKQQLEILTVTEVAEYLKVAERTIYRLAAAKKIPTFNVGGTWRFSSAEIDEWIRRQSTDSRNKLVDGERGPDDKARRHGRRGGTLECATHD